MKLSALIKLSIASAALVFTFTLPAHAATYYKCKSGYNFETKSGAARCYKAASASYKSPLACGNVTIPVINKSVGHFLKKDHQGKADKCVGTFKVGFNQQTSALDLACPAGYSLEIRSGADRCKKSIPASVRAPEVKVNK